MRSGNSTAAVGVGREVGVGGGSGVELGWDMAGEVGVAGANIGVGLGAG